MKNRKNRNHKLRLKSHLLNLIKLNIMLLSKTRNTLRMKMNTIKNQMIRNTCNNNKRRRNKNKSNKMMNTIKSSSKFQLYNKLGVKNHNKRKSKNKILSQNLKYHPKKKNKWNKLSNNQKSNRSKRVKSQQNKSKMTNKNLTMKNMVEIITISVINCQSPKSATISKRHTPISNPVKKNKNKFMIKTNKRYQDN